jgi:hypothetical protein
VSDLGSTPLDGVEDVEGLVARLATLESEPLAERVRVLSAVQEQLTQALTELDHL